MRKFDSDELVTRGTKSMGNLFIADRFKRILSIHIVKNLLVQDGFHSPLLLGIHGPTGEGKTFQCEQVLTAMGVRWFLISGGQLESHKAGDPARLVRDTYLNASHAMERGECKCAVILMNDVDTGLGNWGDMVQYTVNRQTVFGELMHLVDFPTRVEQRVTLRVPIILTGNDFTKLYEPLIRAGRMTAFEWIPSLEEKISAIAFMFPELNVSQCQQLVQDLNLEAQSRHMTYPNGLPIAFYYHLKASLSDDYIWNAIRDVGIERIVDVILSGRRPKFISVVGYEKLRDAGVELITSGQILNHLRY